MKKLFTALAVAALSLIPTALSAKTVTFTINDPSAAYLYETITYNYIKFDGQTSKDVDLADNADVLVYVNSGYNVISVSVGSNSVEVGQYGPTFISSSVLTDGSTVVIETKAKDPKTYYVVADPTQVSLTVDGDNVYNSENFTDGKWTVKSVQDYPTFSFTCTDGYVLSNVTRSNDSSLFYSDSQRYQSSYSFNLSGESEGETYTVTCAKLSELRTTHVSLEVLNNDNEVVTDAQELSKVTVSRGDQEVPQSEWSDIAINPANELPLGIRSSNYTKSLYKCTLNGVAQTVSYNGGFSLSNLQNGDKIQVWPDYPDVNVAITFEGFTDAISGVTVDDESVDAKEWSATGYTVKLGSSVQVSLDTNNYSVDVVTVNGENYPTYYCQFTVSSEDPITVNITGSKKEPYKVTLNYEPGTILVYNASNANPDKEIVLPDTGVAEIEIPQGDRELYVKAVDGYKVTEIFNETTGSPEYSTSSVSINGDCSLTIYTVEYSRDETCVVYLEEGLNWYRKVLLISPDDLREEIELEDGYNFISYNALDRPFSFSCYPMSGEAVVYVNGEKLDPVYDNPALANFESNSVMKVFTSANSIPTYALTVDNQSEGAVLILADYVNEIESNEAQVIGKTDVKFEITEPAAETTESTTTYSIKVNDQEVTANAEGNFIATITSDSKIEITKSETDPDEGNSDGIIEINAEKEGNIYDLRGVKVMNPKKGIFIRNGKKIVL